MRESKIYIIDGKQYSFEKTEDGRTISYGADTGFNIENYQRINTYAGYRKNADYIGMLIVDPLKVALFSKIETVTFDGVDCYSIEVKNENTESKMPVTMYFEKETGLLRKYNGEEFYYSFNKVSDEFFEMPDEKDTIDIMDETYISTFNKNEKESN